MTTGRWIPHRTGAVVMLAMLAVFDALAIPGVLTVLGALAASGTITSANALTIY